MKLPQYKNHYTKYLIPALLLFVVVVFPIPAFALFEKTMYDFVTQVFGFFFMLSGLVLDFGFHTLVFGMGGKINDGGIGVAVNELWTVVRDVFNLLFIFGLIYIGLKTIWNAENSSTRKSLVLLISAALLINFSLFITKAIIDFANIATKQIYVIMLGTKGMVTDTQTLFGLFSIDGISAAFMNLLNLQTLFNKTVLTGANAVGAYEYTYIVGILFLLLIATFAFAAGGIMLIVRFVALIFYMILSPIMFLGWVLPSFGKYSSDYWNSFLKYAFFAPAYAFTLFMSFKTLLVMRNALGLDGGLDYALALQGDKISDAGVILFFLVAAGFLIASIIVAQKMGMAGSGLVIKVGHNMRGRGQRMLAAGTVGAAARAGRTFVGQPAHAVANSRWANRLAQKNFVFRSAVQGAHKVADSSFDARNFSGVGRAMGIGDGKRGGFTTRLKEDKAIDAKINEAVGEVKEKSKDEEKADKNHLTATTALASAQDELREATKDERDEIQKLSKEYKTAGATRKKEIVNEQNALKATIDVKEKDAEPKLIRRKEEVVRTEKTLGIAKANRKFRLQQDYAESIQNTKWMIPFFGKVRANSRADEIYKQYGAADAKTGRKAGKKHSVESGATSKSEKLMEELTAKLEEKDVVSTPSDDTTT